MRIILGLFIISIGINIPIHGQLTDRNEIRKLIWPSDDPYADLTQIPKEWQSASAVILYQSYSREYSKKGKKIRKANSLRKRIKLLDHSALQNFSEFAFDELNNKNTHFKKKVDFSIGEIKIIKQDGRILMVDLNDAVDDGSGGKKIAVSNLEIGDILDYYYYQHEVMVDIHGHAFQPVISTLGEAYPILHQDLSFKVHKNFYVKFNTYNDAPKVITSIDLEKDIITYSISDHNRPAESYTQWLHPNLVLPTIKFQVIQADSEEQLQSLNVFNGFYGAKLKQETSHSDILDLARRSFRLLPLKDPSLYSFVSSKCNKCNISDQLMLAYYYLRNDRFVDMYEAFSYSEAGADISIKDYGNTVMNDIQFINVMAGYLIAQNIEFEILATVPRPYGSIKEVLLAEEMTYILKVDTEDAPIYLSRFTTNSEFNLVPYDIQGQEAIAMDYSGAELFLKSQEHQLIKIPVASSSENKSHSTSIVSFDPDKLNKVYINRRSMMTGHNKDFDRGDILTIYDLSHEDQQALSIEPPASRFGVKLTEVDEFNTVLRQDAIRASRDQIQAIERASAIEFDFEIEDFSDVELMNTGRWFGPFEYRNRFSTTQLVKKAGQHYLFNIGQLIGKQMTIDKAQADRQFDIHMAFARSFQEDVIVEIPKGYKVEGIDRLIAKVENGSGTFVSKAYVQDNKLHLSTHKDYNKIYDPVKNWPDILEFLEAAYHL